jgi:hypothetical protein
LDIELLALATLELVQLLDEEAASIGVHRRFRV